MGIQYTENYQIPFMDDATSLNELDTLTRDLAYKLDAAMGKAGYVPPDATTFAALSSKVTQVKADLDALVDLTKTARPIKAVAPTAMIPLVGTWINFDAGNYDLLRYSRDSTGVVRLFGLIANTAAFSAIQTITTLPAGFRPRKTVLAPVVYNGAVASRLDITPAGELRAVPTGTVPAGAYWAINLLYPTLESTVSAIA